MNCLLFRGFHPVVSKVLTVALVHKYYGVHLVNSQRLLENHCLQLHRTPFLLQESHSFSARSCCNEILMRRV